MKILLPTLIGISLIGNAVAAPIQLDPTDFAAAMAPLNAVVETFEKFAAGYKPVPLTLANSSFTSFNPYVGDIADLFPTRALIDQQGDREEVFSDFAAGTRLFGVDLAGYISSDQMLVTVVGMGGTSSFQRSIASFGGFVGVGDELGLLSVTFLDLGSGNSWGNYAFDNVKTGVSVVPEPGPLSLSALGLLVVAAAARRRR